jgi:ribosomal protein S18 acetylase RimI-like enzyme
MKITYSDKMISICTNTDDNFTAIRAIADEVWPIAYGPILSQAQLDYMMDMMYSVESLQQQAASNKTFILAIDDGIPVGFASYEFNYNGTSKTKINKIYILSNQQGKGTGRILIDYITKQALRNNQQGLLLNVNKNNVAQHFYKKLGFAISSEEIIDIGNGYVMDDYVMEIAIQLERK